MYKNWKRVFVVRLLLLSAIWLTLPFQGKFIYPRYQKEYSLVYNCCFREQGPGVFMVVEVDHLMKYLPTESCISLNSVAANAWQPAVRSWMAFYAWHPTSQVISSRADLGKRYSVSVNSFPDDSCIVHIILVDFIVVPMHTFF